jgi:hypothetical protein
LDFIKIKICPGKHTGKTDRKYLWKTHLIEHCYPK